MSNSTRIWIGYVVMALTPFAVSSAAIAGAVIEPHDSTLASAVAFGIFAAWAALLFGYQVWAACWRCGERLHRVATNLYSPIVLRRHCLSCGVRHASKPMEIRINPMGHFGKGARH